MIGWERPPLDELGCSNGTFVYGYRVGSNRSMDSIGCFFSYLLPPFTSQVFVDGDFHKSVMSSACTKVSGSSKALIARKTKVNHSGSCCILVSSVCSGERQPARPGSRQRPDAGIQRTQLGLCPHHARDFGQEQSESLRLTDCSERNWMAAAAQWKPSSLKGTCVSVCFKESVLLLLGIDDTNHILSRNLIHIF